MSSSSDDGRYLVGAAIGALLAVAAVREAGSRAVRLSDPKLSKIGTRRDAWYDTKDGEWPKQGDRITIAAGAIDLNGTKLPEVTGLIDLVSGKDKGGQRLRVWSEDDKGVLLGFARPSSVIRWRYAPRPAGARAVRLTDPKLSRSVVSWRDTSRGEWPTKSDRIRVAAGAKSPGNFILPEIVGTVDLADPIHAPGYVRLKYASEAYNDFVGIEPPFRWQYAPRGSSAPARARNPKTVPIGQTGQSGIGGMTGVGTKLAKRFHDLVARIDALEAMTDAAYERGATAQAQDRDAELDATKDELWALHAALEEEGESVHGLVDVEQSAEETLASAWVNHLGREDGLYGGYLDADDEREGFEGLARRLTEDFGMQPMTGAEAKRMAKDAYRRRYDLKVTMRHKAAMRKRATKNPLEQAQAWLERRRRGSAAFESFDLLEGTMRIPLSTKKGRFYVATSMTKAYSSWSTLGDAKDAFKRLPKAERDHVIGIVEVRGVLTTKHPKPKEKPTRLNWLNSGEPL